MTITEFEKLTGFFPTSDLFKSIEASYYDYEGSKAEFCRAYKENANGLAEKIQRAANLEAADASIAADREAAKKDAEIEDLKKKLETEQEWRPYVDTHNYVQSRYDELKAATGRRILTDEEAKDLLYNWYGFAREKVIIYHTIPSLEVNRHRELRKAGDTERLPLYNATDWNYIRFDCGCMTYELVNDELRLFLH